MTNKTADKSTSRLNFTTWIVIGLLLGIAWGLFFGESGSWIKWIGDVFVGLLQMTVLPYVTISLVVNIGRLSLSEGVRLLRSGVVVMLVLWFIGLLTLAVMTQAFPHWETGSFFSSRFTEEPPTPNWLDLFVPANPFRALSDNSIPAVVIFCIGLGIAMMTLPNKERLLGPLDVAMDALAKLNKLVVRLTPIGMFGIVGYTAGSIDFGQFSLIRGYLLTYGTSTVILAFVVLPAFVTALTRLKYREILRASRDPLISAFVIGNTFVVLPMIISAVKKLSPEHSRGQGQGGNEPDYLVPLAYPFPDLGRIVGLIFIPFAAWFYGTTISPDRFGGLLGVGLLGSFGKPVTTIPLLLNIAELPSDIFNLYLASGPVAARFGDLVKTMHLITFAILTTCLLNGIIKINWQRLFIGGLVSVLLLGLTATSIRAYLAANFRDDFSKEKLVTERELTFPRSSTLAGINTLVLSESTPNPDPIEPGQTRVQRIKKRGMIRIGYDPEKMPFAYKNALGELIGFDIEMAYYLADDLQVDIEFILIDQALSLHEQLHKDHFDIAMSALEGTVNQAAQLPAIDPYMDVTLAVVVRDHEKRRFRNTEEIWKIPNLKLAVVRGSYFAERAPKVLPESVQLIELESAAEFFEDRHEKIHGLVISAESGSAWTLRRPGYTVANPLRGRIRVPLYYLTAADLEFETFLQNWLTLKRSVGTYEQLYDYWILGQEKQIAQPRWCIVRDVLGWVE
jgi:Na+/H+-dicarboxylate symporter/ABC-type amino acid transport substrate-binding protein